MRVWLQLQRASAAAVPDLQSCAPSGALPELPRHNPVDLSPMKQQRISKTSPLTRFTDRDLKILQKLNAAGWLTSKQIRNYFFPDKSTNAVCKRLRKLIASRFIAMARLSSTEPALYRLAGQGRLALLDRTAGADENITIPNQVPRKIRHFTAINDLRYYFEKNVQDPPAKLSFFLSETELGRYYQNRAVGGDPFVIWLKNYRIIPDAVARIRAMRDGQARILNLYVEYDEGTEHASFFGRTKVRQYSSLFTRKHEHLKDVKVLTFARSINRLIGLMRQTVLEQAPRHLFYFALLEKLSCDGWPGSEVFLDPHDYFARAQVGTRTEVVERQISQVPKHALIDLPVASPRAGTTRRP